MSKSFTIEVHTDKEDSLDSLREDVLTGLTSQPKELPPKWFYDKHGSDLFERITRLDEYYPTRREREILETRSQEIAALSQAESLVELGSGTAKKTHLLLNALEKTGQLQEFIPFDVSEKTLRESAALLNQHYPSISVHGVVGDFQHHLPFLPQSQNNSPRLIVFLGGTIGNFKPKERIAFLNQVASGMKPKDTFLLGTDLLKNKARLEAAYNDKENITAAFNKNILRVVNRELQADFAVEAFDHLARFDQKNSWIEMLLRSTRHQTVHIGALGIEVEFAANEEMRTEVSTKFTQETVKNELDETGLKLSEWWTDPADDFALSLSHLCNSTIPR